MTALTLPTPRFLPIVLFLIAILPSMAVADSAEADGITSTLQAQVAALKKQHVAAQKQVALKKAATEVATKRVAELQKQLKETQTQMAAEAKLLEAATADEATKAKQFAALTAELTKHQHADSLLAAAAVVQTQVTAAEAQHQQLREQASALRTLLFDQQQLENKASTNLKNAKEQLPKTLEELKKARTTYDAAAREVDVAQLAVTNARETVNTAKAAVAPEQSRLQKANAALVQVNASLKLLEDSLVALQSAAKTAGTSSEDAGKELAQSIATVKPLQKRATELVAVATKNVSSAAGKIATAETALKAASGKLREQQDKYATASRAHFKLQLSVADLQGADPLHTAQIADAKAEQENLTAQQKELAPKIAAAAKEVDRLEADYVAKQTVAETELETLNRFVSFSHDIAPIFAKRCVACHNTRTASGRLNMDSFAALMKGGESGEAFESHDAESSLLWAMIDDGSMPKDADPLTAEEIALVAKWINVGTPLDAGVVASADLFRIMPEAPQPLPPETYRVPIPVTATAFNADATILASSGYHEILLWNTADGSLLRRITNVAERVYDLEFTADGSQLVVAAGTPGQLGEVKLFSTADGKHLSTLVRTTDAVFAVSWSPDGKQIAAAGADRVVYVVDIASQQTTLQIEDHADWVMDVNWSADGKQLVTASRDKTSKIFDVSNGRSLVTFSGHGNAVYSATFLADGKSVVSGGSDKQARIWDAAKGKETRKIGGFGSDVFRVAVTADGHLLTACADKNAREHNLADGKAIRTFAGHKDWVYTLSYNAEKKLIATGSYDGEIRVWNSEDGSMATSFIAIPKAGEAAVAAAQK